MIKTDVGWRDYRLVDQSTYLAVFNPRFGATEDISRGVEAEIEYASLVGVPTFVYQDPSRDPDGQVAARFFRESGSMGEGPAWIEAVDSIGELVSRVTA